MTNDPDWAVRMVAYYELVLLVNVVWNIVSLHSNASCLFQDKDNTLDALLKWCEHQGLICAGFCRNRIWDLADWCRLYLNFV